MSEYRFTEWSQHQKEQRMSELMDSAEVKHTDERKAQIAREIAHLAFEMDFLAEQKEQPNE